MKLFEVATPKKADKATQLNARAKAQEDKKKVAAKASDLSSVLDAVKSATTLEDKKAAANKLAAAFTAGGKDKFLKSVANCKTPGDVDKLAYNAALKGEGHGTKLY